MVLWCISAKNPGTGMWTLTDVVLRVLLSVSLHIHACVIKTAITFWRSSLEDGCHLSGKISSASIIPYHFQISRWNITFLAEHAIIFIYNYFILSVAAVGSGVPWRNVLGRLSECSRFSRRDRTRRIHGQNARNYRWTYVWHHLCICTHNVFAL